MTSSSLGTKLSTFFAVLTIGGVEICCSIDIVKVLKDIWRIKAIFCGYEALNLFDVNAIILNALSTCCPGKP